MELPRIGAADVKAPHLVIAVILLTSLAECGTGERRALSQSSNSITLRWWNNALAYAHVAGPAEYLLQEYLLHVNRTRQPKRSASSTTAAPRSAMSARV